jgi:hypothetical protein
MFGTTTGQSPGDDFAAFGNKIPKRFGIFVINYQTGISTEPANLPAMIYSSSSFGFLASSAGS